MTTDQVFEGLKVWDMSWVGVGPLTARYLADYGATVVRLDSTIRPDVLRLGPPFRDGVPGINNSQFYADYNASKLGIGLDLMNPLGREVALRLVDWCDVLLESFTPKTMANWGMSYHELRERNPGLVMLSTCMQGQTGPRKDYRGFGNIMAALGGFYEICGYADRDPVPVYGAYTDFVSQRFAATALVAALDHRRRTGEGQHLDLSQYEAALQMLGTELLDYEVNGRVATRRGNRSDLACPHGVYPTLPVRDHEAWMAIACETDDHWLALRRAMGDPDWARDPTWLTFLGRKSAEEELDQHIAAWTAGWDQNELLKALQPDVPAGPVHDQTGLHEDEQIVHRGYFVTLEHTEMGACPYDGLQATLSRTPGRLSKAGPCVGEDTYTILSDLLGMDEDEIGDLLAAEAVEITGG
ncbi:MAG: CoA transferase [Acidimicrobiales bacterium]|nr:CoA transferase [Acidimicrobiales bacterium]